MPQQLDLPLETSKELPPEAERRELEVEYKNAVGIDPTLRFFSLEILKAGIADPETERRRVGEIDRKEDQENRLPFQPRRR